MHAVEVLKRYAKGDRNFQGADLREQNFCNKDLSGADFSWADLSGADIRGTSFKQATLIGTKFCAIKRSGLPSHWMCGHLVLALSVVCLIALCFSLVVTSFVSRLTTPSDTEDIVVGVIFFAALWGGWALFFLHGVRAVSVAAAVAVAGVGAATFAVAGSVSVAGAVAFAGAFAGALLGAVAFAGIFTVTRVNFLSGVVAVSLVCTVSVVYGFLLIAVGLSVLQMFVSFLVAQRAMKGDERYILIHRTSVAWTLFGGTTFYDANLCSADFSFSTIRNTDLRAKSLYQTCWRQLSPKINLNRIDGTYLANQHIRELVRTGIGGQLSFKRLDLRGVNLAQAELRNCNFEASDLSGANLQRADLTDAKLVQTQLDGADLTEAVLTGAIIADWGITTTTSLKDIHCDYVYMKDMPPGTKEKHRQRKPDDLNQEFENGDFADFIQPLTDTLDLYHNRNVDPRAIAIAFQQLSNDNPEANLLIVAMELVALKSF